MSNISLFLISGLVALGALPLSAQEAMRVSQGTSQESFSVSEDHLLQGELQTLVIPAAEFSSDGVDSDSSFFNFSTGRLSGTANGTGCSMAPAYLPDGAVVTSIRGYINDSDGAENLLLELRKVNVLTAVATVMGSASSVGTPGLDVIVGSITLEPEVNYPEDVVYVTTCVTTVNLAIISVELIYFN